MKKYFILGVVSFSLLATTVYAFHGNGRNNPINQTTMYHQNCPYHTNNEICPYYNDTAVHQNCPYHTESSSCPNCNGNANNNASQYSTSESHHGRHYRYHHQ